MRATWYGRVEGDWGYKQKGDERQGRQEKGRRKGEGGREGGGAEGILDRYEAGKGIKD